MTGANAKPAPLLQPESRTAAALSRPVFFIGFMGAGKTSVSRKLARKLGLGAIDMDTYLERREGRRVKDIFAAIGEEGFRDIETDVLRELAAKDPLLVSCGGGIVKMPRNRVILRESGFVVHLRVGVDEAASRISDKSTRPLFQNLDDARALAEERAPLYDDVADATVDTAGKTVNAIAYEVKRLLEEEGILCLPPK